MDKTVCTGRRGPTGFTVVEMLIVMLFTALMAAIVAPAITDGQTRMSLNNAANSVVFLGSRARAHAANRGATALLEIDPATDQGWIRFGNDTLVGSFIDFAEQYEADVDVSDGGGLLTICYSPRGYARPGCADVSRLPVYITFLRSGRTDSVQIKALGQVEVSE